MHRPRKLPDLVESIYDAGLDPSLWNDVVVGIRDFVGGQACGLFSKDFDQQVRRHPLLLRGRSALHPALFGDPFQVRSADDPAATRPDREHPRSRQFRRISPRALLSGMDAAAGLSRCRQCRAREIERALPGDDDGALRPPHGRRRDEAPDVADRAARKPRAARQPGHQLEADAGHGARGCPGQSVIRHLPAEFQLPFDPRQCERLRDARG